MAIGAISALGEPLVWRNAIVILLMLATAVLSVVTATALWRRKSSAVRTFVMWYSALGLTVISRHLYLEWEWVRISNLVVELGLIALIGVVLGRYVTSQLSGSEAFTLP